MGTPERPAREILDQLLEGCVILSPEYRYLYVNDAAARYGQTTKEQVLGRTMFEVFPGLETTAMFATVRRCMEERAPGQIDEEFVFPDGSRTWFDARLAPVPEGLLILSIDITARKRAEARFRAAFEQAAVGMVQLSPSGHWLRVNQKLCDMLGYAPDEMVGRPFADFTLPEDHDADLEAMGRLLSGGLRASSTERRVRRKDGATIWLGVTASVARTPSGELDYVMSVVEDVTERRQSLQALRESEATLRQAQAVAKVGSWVYDLQDRLTWSEETYRVFGVTPATFVPSIEGLMRLAHPEDRSAMQSWIRACMAGERPGEATFRVIWPDGSVRYVSGRGDLFHDADGRPSHMAGTAQDVTESKRHEHERASLTEQLQTAQKMEAVGRLAGGMAHDFNNLLSVILGYADFASHALREEDPLRTDLEEIRGAAERAATLTRQLLAFSRRQVLEPQVVELNRVATDLEKMLRRLIGEDIQLVLSLAPDLGYVKVDPGQVEQVIMNLVVNARDAMPTGGTLTLETANVELDGDYAARHVGVRPGPYVRLTICDTGCGMDEATRQRIFEPFFTTKEKDKGTGLGLSTVYGIVKQSGGTVWASSEPGRGTVFDIYLPRVTGAPSPAAAPPVAERPRGGSETLLVVEDEEPVRNLVTRILQAAGYRVLSAANGGEALLACEQHPGPIHLLLTDVVMPQMSGKQLAERLGLLKPGLRVLYMSGYPDEAIASHGVRTPGTTFLGKPFGAAELTRKVRSALDEPSLR